MEGWLLIWYQVRISSTGRFHLHSSCVDGKLSSMALSWSLTCSKRASRGKAGSVALATHQQRNSGHPRPHFGSPSISAPAWRKFWS